jgi:hypothetical protein
MEDLGIVHPSTKVLCFSKKTFYLPFLKSITSIMVLGENQMFISLLQWIFFFVDMFCAGFSANFFLSELFVLSSHHSSPFFFVLSHSFFLLSQVVIPQLGTKRDDEDLYAKLKSLQRQLEFLEIQVSQTYKLHYEPFL